MTVVEAYTASWIEIRLCSWSETNSASRLIQPRGLKSVSLCTWRRRWRSRLIQPRGLKYHLTNGGYLCNCRGLYSLVDWNNVLCYPYDGDSGRGLYSLMDWNRISIWASLRKWIWWKSQEDYGDMFTCRQRRGTNAIIDAVRAVNIPKIRQ